VFQCLLALGLATIVGNVYFFLAQGDTPQLTSSRPQTVKQNVRIEAMPGKQVLREVQKVVDEDADMLDEDYETDNPQDTVRPVSLKEGQERILEIFRDAGVAIDNATLASLPSWNDIVANVGDAPKIYGLDRCESFRSSIPAVDRMVGCCGMFNSGTNLVTRLLKENCKIPERVEHYGWNGTFERWGIGPFEAHGMRWQVPWGKHTAAKYREQHTTKKAGEISKESTLPVVTIRNPYDWMKRYVC